MRGQPAAEGQVGLHTPGGGRQVPPHPPGGAAAGARQAEDGPGHQLGYDGGGYSPL